MEVLRAVASDVQAFQDAQGQRLRGRDRLHMARFHRQIVDVYAGLIDALQEVIWARERCAEVDLDLDSEDRELDAVVQDAVATVASTWSDLRDSMTLATLTVPEE